MNHLINALDRLARPRILVIGDLILDRYTWGDVQRISPEAPVPILRCERTDVRPGGAASVAMLLQSLDATVTLAGVTGDDANGRALRELLEHNGVNLDPVLTDPRRPTTTKNRLMARAAHRRPQPILRMDRETTRRLDAALHASLMESVLAQIDQHAAVLIADYAKGVCSPALLARLIARARECGVPVFVDPARIPNYRRYRGASAVIPNRTEAEMVAARPIRATADALEIATRLREQTSAGAVLLKLDSAGMVLAERGRRGRSYPARPRDVCDVTGAGDTVLAVIGLCRASGFDWDDAVPLANLAAGMQVERLGVSPITWSDIHAELVDQAAAGGGKLLALAAMQALAEAYRIAGRKVVLTNGCFDLLHPGHVACLQEAAGLGDVLIVAINSDRSVGRLKGQGRPVLGETHRAAMLAALECVDHVVIFDDDTPHALLDRLRPDVLVKGGTYAIEEVVGREVVEHYGGTVHVTGKVEGMSSTGLLAALRA